MTVDVTCDSYGRVPKPFGYNLKRHALLKQDAGVNVPKSVEADWQFEPLCELPECVADAVWKKVAPQQGREHPFSGFPQLTNLQTLFCLSLPPGPERLHYRGRKVHLSPGAVALWLLHYHLSTFGNVERSTN